MSRLEWKGGAFFVEEEPKPKFVSQTQTEKLCLKHKDGCKDQLESIDCFCSPLLVMKPIPGTRREYRDGKHRAPKDIKPTKRNGTYWCGGKDCPHYVELSEGPDCMASKAGTHVCLTWYQNSIEELSDSNNETFRELQKYLHAIYKYCNNECPIRETCTDENRTEEQKACALFTQEQE